ncbi:hypothetical_protein [Candidozyma auris]|uniref:adenylate cyclase-binding protein n=1 Tax=Candidozyma auris TaxID=498019 RepID=UPI000D2D112E|nr:adenylate cyclase-binding protein [[Candida] auris]QEO23255.1 hypothetical_protein [[Candida] auris]GBL49301.1 hypothetical protein CAJCM15448_15750 [[Candida] auris]
MPPQGPAEENQLNVQGYNIVTILKRLEAATCRLEDITIFQEEANKAKPLTRDAVSDALSAPSSTNISESTSAITDPPAAKALSEASAPAKFVTVFDEFIKSNIVPFVDLSNAIDAIVGSAAQELHDAFVEQAKFLGIVAHTRKPALGDQNLNNAVAPINARIEAITTLKDQNRRSNFFNHLNTISEGAPVLGWIVSDTPLSYIPEFKDSAQFWSNRVMKEYKDKDNKHVDWVKAFLSIFDGLRAYVKEYHSTGLAWNPRGATLGESLAAALAGATDTKKAASSSGGAAPPPPPPAPPANLFDDVEKPKEATSSSSGGLKAVFNDLNKGENITAGLKKVDKSQMTHKNPSLRQQGVIKKPTPPKKPTSLSSPSGTVKKTVKPPRVELVDGAKWIVENLTAENTKEPVVIDAEMQHSVFIGNTDSVTIQINGKGNAVSLSETKNTGVVVHSLISGIDVIKSVKFGLQVTGVVPLITIDKSDEGNIYLSQESIDNDSSVVTSNTTAVNINVPTEEDYNELPVPEQLQHFFRNGKLVSEVVEHAG